MRKRGKSFPVYAAINLASGHFLPQEGVFPDSADLPPVPPLIPAPYPPLAAPPAGASGYTADLSRSHELAASVLDSQGTDGTEDSIDFSGIHTALYRLKHSSNKLGIIGKTAFKRNELYWWFSVVFPK
jgi:hypothetical protein